MSHLRFGKQVIKSTYLLSKEEADFVACHNFSFLEKYDMLANAKQGATFLLNSPFSKDEVWAKLPKMVQQQIIDKKLKFYVIDAYTVAAETGMGTRINTIMQTCFFAISGVLPKDEAITKIKEAIKKTYGKRGESVVKMNYAAVDASLAHLHEVKIDADRRSGIGAKRIVPELAPIFVQDVTAEMMAGRGDGLPVSMIPEDGTYPTATTQWEKRGIAQMIPEWIEDNCIQCGNCSFVCPHASIRAKFCNEAELEGAPGDFQSAPMSARAPYHRGARISARTGSASRRSPMAVVGSSSQARDASSWGQVQALLAGAKRTIESLRRAGCPTTTICTSPSGPWN